MRNRLILIPLSVIALAACSGNNGSNGGGGSSGIFGSSSGVFGGSSGGSSGSSGSSGGSSSVALSAFVLNLFNSTNDTALPVDLTTVMLNTSSENPDDYASLFASSSGG